MKNIKIIYITILLLLSVSNIYTQKEIKVKGVKGSWIISNISPQEAKEKAILEAKKAALLKAGISEQISETNTLNKSENKGEYKQIFNSISTVEVNGKVLSYNVISEKKKVDKFDNFVVEVIIDAVVVKYKTKKDISFDFKVSKIESFYRNNEVLVFSFTPFKNGYLKIFNISDTESFLLYPFKSEKYTHFNDIPDNLFFKNSKIQFPINTMFGNPRTGKHGYTVSTTKEKEVNHLIFVFTKSNIPFYNEVNYKNIIKWIYSTPPDQRIVKYFGFTITK